MTDLDPMKLATQLIRGAFARASNHVLLTWEGSKIPRGAHIDGIEIGWTQHGIVTGVGGQQLGQYERLVEFGGENRKLQVMVIGTNHLSVTPPPGGTVEPLVK